MARWRKEKEINPELMLSSPANRPLTTCKVIADVIGYQLSGIKTDKRIYHAGEDQLLKVVSELSDNYESVIVFGHNPGFTDFANSLLGESIMNIPTCGIVAGKLRIDSWKQVSPACGKLEFFDFPKKNKKK